MPSPTTPHGLDDLRIYGTGFAGRRTELAALDRAWSEGVRVFVLHAQGGAGKTRVAAEWLAQVGGDGWRGAGPKLNQFPSASLPPRGKPGWSPGFAPLERP